MLETWEGKAPSEIVKRTWEVPTNDDDSLASFVSTVTGAMLDASERSGDEITLTLSAGTAGATATADIVATTVNGLIVTAKFYLPIRADGFALSYTARDICNKALRKVTGVAGTATADELDDALEVLSDMLAAWSGEGADLQVSLPVAASDTLYLPHWAVEGVKASLAVNLQEFYGAPVDFSTAMTAKRGLQRIKAKLLPEEREGQAFF